MAITTGKDGIVSIAGTEVAQITDWTLNIEATAIDTTVIGNDWKQAIQGSKGWNASVNGIIDMASSTQQRAITNELLTSADGYIADVRFEAEAGTTDGYFYGSAVITGVSVSNPGNDDVLRAAFNMQGHNTLYFAQAV